MGPVIRPLGETKPVMAVSDAPVTPVPEMVAVAVMTIGGDRFKVSQVPDLVAVTTAGEYATVTDPVTVASPFQQLQFTGKEKPVAVGVTVAGFAGEQKNPGLTEL
jgi:hypothetical protein